MHSGVSISKANADVMRVLAIILCALLATPVGAAEKSEWDKFPIVAYPSETVQQKLDRLEKKYNILKKFGTKQEVYLMKRIDGLGYKGRPQNWQQVKKIIERRVAKRYRKGESVPRFKRINEHTTNIEAWILAKLERKKLS